MSIRVHPWFPFGCGCAALGLCGYSAARAPRNIVATMAAECQSPTLRLELEEFRSNLELALGQLPSRVAQVFQLYAVEERPNSEVCQRLNMSESNLWVMLLDSKQGRVTPSGQGCWSGV